MAAAAKVEPTMVKMEDGREVAFAGKRRMLKEIVIDQSKLVVDGDTVTLEKGAVSIRIDFLNGKTLTHVAPVGLIAQYAGHGGSQKIGDSAAGEKDLDDAIIAVESTAEQLDAGNWTAESEGGGGFSGASVVVQAIAQLKNLDVKVVKAWLDKRLTDAAAKGEKLTRQALYASFRNPRAATYPIIKELEEARAAKATNAADANAELDALPSGA